MSRILSITFLKPLSDKGFKLIQKEPLNNDEIDKKINSCDASRGKVCYLAVLDTALTLS